MAYGRKYSKRTTSHQGRKNSAVVVSRKRRTTKIANLRLNPTVKKLVDRRINKSNEVRSLSRDVCIDVDFDGPIDFDDIRGIMTNLWIPQGDGSAQRTGDRIKLISLVLDVRLNAPPRMWNDESSFDANRNSMIIRFMVFSPKRYPAHALFGGTEKGIVADKLLQWDDAEVPYDGNQNTAKLPLNPAAVRKHYDRSFTRVGPVTYYEHSGDPFTGYAGVSHTASDWFKTIRIPLKVKNKVLHYESDNFPANFNPQIAFGFTNLKHSANPDIVTRVNATVRVTMKWYNM